MSLIEDEVGLSFVEVEIVGCVVIDIMDVMKVIMKGGVMDGVVIVVLNEDIVVMVVGLKVVEGGKIEEFVKELIGMIEVEVFVDEVEFNFDVEIYSGVDMYLIVV